MLRNDSGNYCDWLMVDLIVRVVNKTVTGGDTAVRQTYNPTPNIGAQSGVVLAIRG